MGMSDCEKCWDTLCACGWKYRYWKKKERIELAAAALGVSKELLKDKFGTLVPENHPMAESEQRKG